MTVTGGLDKRVVRRPEGGFSFFCTVCGGPTSGHPYTYCACTIRVFEEPSVGSTVELIGDSPQAGWRYHHIEGGWVRVFSDGCLDAGHPLDWRFAGWCVLADGPHYRDRGHEVHHEGPRGFHYLPDDLEATGA